MDYMPQYSSRLYGRYHGQYQAMVDHRMFFSERRWSMAVSDVLQSRSMWFLCSVGLYRSTSFGCLEILGRRYSTPFSWICIQPEVYTAWRRMIHPSPARYGPKQLHGHGGRATPLYKHCVLSPGASSSICSRSLLSSPCSHDRSGL